MSVQRKAALVLKINEYNLLTLSLPNVAKGKFRPNFQISFSKIVRNNSIRSCESTGRELSFEWSHHRISATDSKARVTLQNSIKHPGSERVNDIAVKPIINQRQKYTLP